MRLLMNRLAAAAFAVVALVSAALAEGRVALVIGNSGYQHVGALPNPANDAADIGAELTRLGFRVTAAKDLDYNGMRLALRDFSEAADGADVALVYYAGHGIEIDNTNYLVPVNAELKSDRDIEFEAIPLDLVLNAVEAAPGLKIVLIDACRNNPFLGSMALSGATRSIGRGLGRVEPGGVLVGYAARSGTVSQDGDGRNSPYAQALLRYLGEPGLEIGKMFRKVRDTVLETTEGAQEPFTYGSLPGEDLFIVAPLTVSAGAAPSTSVDAEIAGAYADAEGRGTLEGWGAFLDAYAAYPENRLVRLALAKTEALRAETEREEQVASRTPWIELKPGAYLKSPDLTAEDRILIQEALVYAGFDLGIPDGEFGPKTLAAISAARLKYGLSPGIHVDAALIRALPDAKVMASLKSEKARLYDPAELPPGIEPRLARALAHFGEKKRKLRFGYFKGHLYIAVKEGHVTDFHGANKIAGGIGGHLATISDREEDRFISDLFSADDIFIHRNGGFGFGPMFGLYQADRSDEPAGGWAWVTGEPVTYRNFDSGNPDNKGGLQDFARYFTGGRGAKVEFWDDTGSSWVSLSAFIFEFE